MGEEFASSENFQLFIWRNPVLDIMRSSFDLLLPRDQTLFMDMGCFSYGDPCYRGPCFKGLNVGWLCVAQKQDEKEITHRVYLSLSSFASSKCKVFVFNYLCF